MGYYLDEVKKSKNRIEASAITLQCINYRLGALKNAVLEGKPGVENEFDALQKEVNEVIEGLDREKKNNSYKKQTPLKR